MANRNDDLRAAKMLADLQAKQLLQKPAGFVAPNTPPNLTEMYSQWSVWAGNQKDS